MKPTPTTPRNETDRPEATRPTRTNFGGPRLKLHADPIPGHHLCWMNDDGLMIPEALDAGYEFVEDDRAQVQNQRDEVAGRGNDLGRKVRRLVGRNESGGPLYAYLMKIKQEFFEDDQRKIAAHAQRVDDAIRGKQAPTGSPEPDKFYDRGSKISVNTSSES